MLLNVANTCFTANTKWPSSQTKKKIIKWLLHIKKSVAGRFCMEVAYILPTFQKASI